MSSPDTAFYVPPAAQQLLLKYIKAAVSTMNSQWAMREQLLLNDAIYMREKNYGTEHNRARVANSYGDKSRIQDVVVPVVYPQVEAGVSYLSSVFLSGYPIFSAVASPDNADSAIMMDTIMGENSVRGAWVREFNLFFRDGLKHNIHALEIEWAKETTYGVDTVANNPAGEAKPQEVVWAGNKIKRIDPYNLIVDMRVPPAEVASKGEFVGYIELLNRVATKQLLQDLKDKKLPNDKEALESSVSETYYIPQINPNALRESAIATGEFNWMAWATDEVAQKIKYKDVYEVITIYARIIPSDFGLKVPARNQPQIWKLVCINQEVLILAERMTNAHNLLGILVGQPLEDGLGYQTKSYLQNSAPYQDIASALMNSMLHSRRRAVYDRVVYDPSRIRKEDINAANPIARIPVRPDGYGRPVGDAIHAFPYRDDNAATSVQQVSMIKQMADSLQGINPAQQGQFVKGNKTQHEYADVMAHSNARLQTLALFIEAQIMIPLKEMLKLNILQYAPSMELFNRETKQIVAVDPLTLRKHAVEFQISDGMLPSEKLINAETFQVIMQAGDALREDFNLAAFLVYYLKSTGAKHLEDFRYSPEEKAQRQKQQLAMMQAQQQVKQQGQQQ